MKTEQDMIDEVMDNFDFDKVHKMMAAVGWKWAKEDGGYTVPDIQRLKKAARYLIKKAIKDDVIDISTGGFEVQRGEDYIRLSWGPEYVAEQEDES